MNLDYIEIMVASMPDPSFGAGATRDEVDAAEHTLALPIRGAYRKFLLRFGWGGVADIELYGLGKDVPNYLNLVHVTQSERDEMLPPLPPYLPPIMNAGVGKMAAAIWGLGAGDDGGGAVRMPSQTLALAELVLLVGTGWCMPPSVWPLPTPPQDPFPLASHPPPLVPSLACALFAC